jgi:Cys-tRNA(Pro) deacylase
MEPLQPQHIQAALDRLGLDIKVHIFTTSTATSQEAADSAGTELGSIVKSLCFLVEGRPVVLLVAGDQRADDRKVAAWYGVGRKKVRMADPDTTLQATGYAIGGVPPVGHIQPLPVLIDSTLARYETVYCAAGSSNAIFPIPFEQLVQITGGSVADIVMGQT